MDYLTMSWEERQRLVKEFERRIEAGRQRAVSSAELTNREEGPESEYRGELRSVPRLELERATAEGMPDLDEYELTGAIHREGPARAAQVVRVAGSRREGALGSEAFVNDGEGR
jgi:hypothetical protein